MLDLSQKRVVVIKQGGLPYRLTFRRITTKDWTEYFNNIVTSAERAGRELISAFDADASLVALAENTVESIDGYDLKGQTLAQIKDWKRLIPLSHKLAAGNALTRCGGDGLAETAAQIALEPVETVTLAAFWSADDDGTMPRCGGLKHCFKPPTIEQHRRMRLAESSSKSDGRGSTRIVPSQPMKMTLYDELIQSVEGYSVGDSTDQKAVIAEMDAFHKVVAIAGLFSPAPLEGNIES